MSDLRPIRPIALDGRDDIAPAPDPGAPPEVVLIDPIELLVDDAYQRSMSKRSMRLIRRIVAGFDWSKFKPPVCARTPAGLVVVDGQHTAIAAASLPTIQRIPVLVVGAGSRAEQASAFIAHNRDRLSFTATQLHAAAVVAGDPRALAVERVCAAAGVRTLRTMPGGFRPGDTMAVSLISTLADRRGEDGAAAVLRTLAAMAPLTALWVRAADALANDPEFAGAVPAARLTEHAGRERWVAETEREAQVFAAAHDVPVWRALAIVVYRRIGRKRRAA